MTEEIYVSRYGNHPYWDFIGTKIHEPHNRRAIVRGASSEIIAIVNEKELYVTRDSLRKYLEETSFYVGYGNFTSYYVTKDFVAIAFEPCGCSLRIDVYSDINPITETTQRLEEVLTRAISDARKVKNRQVLEKMKNKTVSFINRLLRNKCNF